MLAPVKVTLDLDSELYRAVKVEAARDDRAVRDVIAEAIEAWLDRREAEEDAQSAAAALDEYRRDGGVAAEELFRQMVAETRATYGSSEGDRGA
jgi:predicted transcriptional regulator